MIATESVAETRELPVAARASAADPSAPTILLVEDDRHIQRSISFQLQRQGYHVNCIADGEDGLEEALLHSYAVVVLDVMLPRLDGLSLCRRLRRARPFQPIILISARASDLDKIAGLEFGADDYIAKPFSPLELEARIRALRRRAAMNTEAVAPPALIELGGVVLDCAQHQLRAFGRVARMTPKEIALLGLLMGTPGRVFTRDNILAQVWGVSHVGYRRAVDAHITRLRLKLHDSLGEDANWIEGVYGVGYSFRDPNEPPAKAEAHADRRTRG